ncbi:hypothetical protein RJC98_08160 [Pseudomonas allii]|uniref:Uncharacterized protein n=1 Tax=Pseudomonas allii TaxID=2740531 RepID=A0ACC6LAE7_9PSED|nr:DUF6543 domain-containing protein [Pseudomonas allii]MDR9875151.1 hypothetical protein [Pseudomonas allii]
MSLVQTAYHPSLPQLATALPAVDSRASVTQPAPLVPSTAAAQPRRARPPIPSLGSRAIAQLTSGTPATLDSPAQVVADQFATRPTVRSVVAALLNEAIRHRYPTLDFDSATTSVAIATQSNPLQYQLRPLVDLALEHLASGTELDFSDRFGEPCKWVNATTGSTLSFVDSTGNRATPLGTQTVELAIGSLKSSLKDAYAQALSQYWGQGADTSASRWRWLSDTLCDTLRIAGLKQPGLDERQRTTLDQVTRYPEASERTRVHGANAAKVFTLDSTMKHAQTSASVLSPDLLITHEVDGHTVVLLVTSAGVVTPYDSLEQFALAWERQLSTQFQFDHLSWTRMEPDGNIFDTQAAILLDRQLQNLDAIKLPAQGSATNLEQLFAQATDTAAWFSTTSPLPPERLEQFKRNLPQWLTKAREFERFAYQRHILDLASSVRRNQGRNFLTDIPDLRTYAEQQLDAELAPKGYTAKDLEITFKVPVGTMGSGYIEPIRMSLVDMALENLSGLPKGAMDIRLRGQPVSDPQMAQALKDLISKVDIGRHYPALLNQQLLSDTDQARERAALFCEQVPTQLVMQALELKLKGQAGISTKGYQFVEAIAQPGVSARRVDGQEITVRPLAFLRKPGATPDVAANLFLIEPVDPTNGPHILYGPQLSPSVQEFPSRDALLAAIQKPGTLQQSILAWLPDEKTRAVYGNGGFKTPNIARYGVFNEFDAPSQPAPTTLAIDGYPAAQQLRRDVQNGDLMNHLFNANARSLVTLADSQSTSDAQSRWASYKELGWLLFNTLLPVLRGPGAMVGWLLQLASIENDIKEASESNTRDPAAIMVDLLVNVGTLLSHTAARPKPARPVGDVPFAQRKDVKIALRRTGAVSPPSQILVEENDPVSARGFIDSRRAFDFAFSSPRDLSPAQWAHLQTFSVPAPAEPGAPIAEGGLKGLYRIDDNLHAHIGNQWFRVARDLDGVFVIDQHDKARTGPPLKRDTTGRWDFDLGPKLRGGMPKGAIARAMDENRRATEQKSAEFKCQAVKVGETTTTYLSAVNKLSEDLVGYEDARKRLKQIWKLTQTEGSNGRFDAQYAEQLRATEALKNKVDHHLTQIEPALAELLMHGKNAINVIRPKKIAGIDDLTEYKKRRSDLYKGMFRALNNSIIVYRRLLAESTAHTPKGEPMSELVREICSGSEAAYQKVIEGTKAVYQNRENLWQAEQALATLEEEWRSDSSFAAKQVEQYLGSTHRQHPSLEVLEEKLTALRSLKLLSVNRFAKIEPGARFYANRFHKTSLDAVNRAFMDLREYNGYTLDERKALLQTIIDTYKQTLRDSIALSETSPDQCRPEYQNVFHQRLNEFIAAAESDLTDVIREELQLTPTQPTYKNRTPKAKNQRVFNTRDKQTLTGTLREPSTAPFNIIDVKDPQTGETLASYSEHLTERAWVEMVEGPPSASQRPRPPKSLATYKKEAGAVMAEAAKNEASINFQKRKLEKPETRDTVTPLDWHGMLQPQADTLRELARQAETHQGTRPETAEVVARWRNEADELQRKARQYAADGYFEVKPTPENVDFLWRYGFVDINLVRRDIPTASGDVFTEYAVRKKGTLEVLWYAHFHYPQPETPRDAYTAAHLKIPAQRYLTQKDLVNQPGPAGAVDLVRAQIGKPLDEKLFLKL